MKVPDISEPNGSHNAVIGNGDVSSSKKPPVIGVRHIQCTMMFIALAVVYAMRVNMSLAVVAMTDKNAANPDYPEFDWSESTKSVILSSFFWGYVITQVPSGALARRFGGRVTLLYGILVCALLNLLTPLFANIGGFKLIIALRVVEGLSQGFIFPSVHTLISSWSRVEERGIFTTSTYSGSQFGTFVMLGISGYLSTSSMGWPSIFYFSGGAGIIWCIIFFFFGCNSPSECKWISNEERKLIESSQAEVSTTEESAKSHMSIPWTKMFTSPAFLVLIISHCAHNWGFWTLLTEIPSYMKSVLGMDIKDNALLSALPYLAMFVMCFVFAGISSLLDKYKCMTLNTTRMVFNSIGLWVPMVTLIGLGYVDRDQRNLAIALLTISVGMNAADYLGFQTNHIDLSPNFAGILMGITNCFANIMSIIAPLLVGFIVTDVTNVIQWRIVFFISGGIYFVGNLLFILFGKTVVQDWNDPNAMKLKRQQNASMEETQN